MKTSESPNSYSMSSLTKGLKVLGVCNKSSITTKLLSYHRELERWNSKINLTSVLDWESSVSRHYLDSACICLAYPGLNQPVKVLDIGTGAGIPGIPLKIMFPSIQMTLLEATQKKVRFIRHAVETINLGFVDIVDGRAEDLARDVDYRGQFDLVVARAVADLSVLVELALPFCRKKGVFIALKGKDYNREIRNSGKAMEQLRASVDSIISVSNHLPTQEGVLIKIVKNCETPVKYPRRSGIPSKSPLTGVKWGD